MRPISVLSILPSVILFSQARTIPYTLNLTALEVQPDGFKRSAVTMNGITPGPVLTANKGDDFLVTTHNTLNDRSMRLTASIHWHGISQPRTAYDDGSAFVTQCPIASGHSYSYRLETSDQAGTFWYHGHLSSQYVDGLRGALIIYDRDDPHKELYDVDNIDTIITLTDWYHRPAEDLIRDWFAFEIPEPVPDSNLLNGIGRYTGGPDVPLAVVKVEQGKRYRFRLINMSAVVPFNFAVEGHNLTVIEADGVNYRPYTVSSISISAGQRYSLILNANQVVANYWISYPSNFRKTLTPGVNDNYNGTNAFAVLRYLGAPAAEPVTPQLVPPVENAFLEYKLEPLVSPPAPTDIPLAITLGFGPSDNGTSISTLGGGNNWTINRAQYTPPTLPTLLQILSNTGNSSAGLPNDVIVLPSNRTIDVTLIGDDNHPFHLHGHNFQVIQSAEGPRNEINPPIRDVVNTNNGVDNSTAVTIRFRTDNPGPWFLHCHKNWHFEAGLAVVFAEDPEGMQRTIHPPAEWDRLCGIYGALPAIDQ